MSTEWQVKAIGNVKGSATSAGATHALACGDSVPVELGETVLEAEGGKFADSLDSFVYYYCKIDPTCENFTLSAVLTACETTGGADYQSGFGILLADTDASEDAWCSFRNYLLAGCFDRRRILGVRLVAGYTSPAAREFESVRILDQERAFAEEVSGLFTGESIALSVAKTDEGFSVSCNGAVADIPGCDFLMKQDATSICVGFAVARNLRLSIRDIAFDTTPGRSSETPADTIHMTVPEYPFPASLLKRPFSPVRCNETLYVAPDGSVQGDGSEEQPLSLEAALVLAGSGTRIVLADGTYTPSSPLVVPREQSGTAQTPIKLEAEHAHACILDGSLLEDETPLFALAGDFWEIRGIVFQHSPLSGLTICGNSNRIENCIARTNGDTGMVIIAPPGTERALWPSGNRVIDCESHDNCDPVFHNADGFGAKLRVGEGNVFYRCIAHDNVDDGFDLYTKSLFGPIEPVEIDSCIAYRNGRKVVLADGSAKFDGVGFKLGGENQPVAHEVWNCVAYRNGASGFSSNSNPACRVHYCTAAENGAGGKMNFLFRSALDGCWIREGLLKRASLPKGTAPLQPLRNPDGTIHLPPCLKASRHGGSRFGADFEKKNILILISSLGGGGAERVACNLATGLSEHHNVWLMYFDAEGTSYPIGDAVRVIDASYVAERNSLIERQVRRVQKVTLIKGTCRKYGIDTTISFLPTPNRANVRFGGRRRIISERNDPSRKPAGYLDNLVFCCRRADYVVFQTRKVQRMLEGETEHSCIIDNPVSVAVTAAPDRAKKIVTVGRLTDQKNHELLIDAFASFAASHDAHHLHIYGVGELEETLKAQVERLGLTRKVHFEGFREDIHEAIRDAEMFVLSSDFEGQPNALIEAMLMGISCISTACTGSEELVHDGTDGLLVPVGDAKALAQAMGTLADNPTLRETLERNAAARADEFSLENIVRQWERIL